MKILCEWGRKRPKAGFLKRDTSRIDAKSLTNEKTEEKTQKINGGFEDEFCEVWRNLLTDLISHGLPWLTFFFIF